MPVPFQKAFQLNRLNNWFVQWKSSTLNGGKICILMERSREMTRFSNKNLCGAHQIWNSWVFLIFAIFFPPAFMTFCQIFCIICITLQQGVGTVWIFGDSVSFLRIDIKIDLWPTNSLNIRWLYEVYDKFE